MLGHFLSTTKHDHVHFFYSEILLQIKNHQLYQRWMNPFAKVTKCSHSMIIITCTCNRIRLDKIYEMWIQFHKKFGISIQFLFDVCKANINVIHLLSTLVNVTKKVNGPN